MTYRLSDRAGSDLDSILYQGLGSFGERQALAYYNALIETLEAIGRTPEIHRVRRELSEPMRVAPFGSHVILYDVDENGIVMILSIRHGRENWQALS